MLNKSDYNYLLSDLSTLKGVGKKTTSLLKKKNINNIFDLLWKLPKSYTDLSFSSKIKDLRIGEIQTIILVPQKYNFPRKKNQRLGTIYLSGLVKILLKMKNSSWIQGLHSWSTIF